MGAAFEESVLYSAPSVSLPLINPSAAGIDIGSSLHILAWNASKPKTRNSNLSLDQVLEKVLVLVDEGVVELLLIHSLDEEPEVVF
jgi:hypothetical protein